MSEENNIWLQSSYIRKYLFGWKVISTKTNLRFKTSFIDTTAQYYDIKFIKFLIVQGIKVEKSRKAKRIQCTCSRSFQFGNLTWVLWFRCKLKLKFTVGSNIFNHFNLARQCTLDWHQEKSTQYDCCFYSFSCYSLSSFVFNDLVQNK